MAWLIVGPSTCSLVDAAGLTVEAGCGSFSPSVPLAGLRPVSLHPEGRAVASLYGVLHFNTTAMLVLGMLVCQDSSMMGGGAWNGTLVHAAVVHADPRRAPLLLISCLCFTNGGN
jgi:hypothetical protein